MLDQKCRKANELQNENRTQHKIITDKQRENDELKAEVARLTGVSEKLKKANQFNADLVLRKCGLESGI